MSTNYYLDTPNDDDKHLGKWAAGRFHAYAPEGVNSFEDWAAQLDGHRIFAEHGVEMTKAEMIEHALEREPRAHWPVIKPDQFVSRGVVFNRYRFC